jgi:hypothetical protein
MIIFERKRDPRRTRGVSLPARIGAGLVVIAVAAACIRLAPKTGVDPPAAVLDRHVLCGEVIRSGDEAEPSAEKNVFLKGKDEAVCSVLIWKELRGIHTLAWKWFDPSGRLYRASEPIVVGADGRVFDRYIAWDKILIFEEKDAGRWLVAVYLDGRLTGTKEFEVKQGG